MKWQSYSLYKHLLRRAGGGRRLLGDYNATSWPQLAKPGLALARTVGLGPECGNYGFALFGLI